MDVVKQLEEHKAQFKPVTIERLTAFNFDMRNLFVTDLAPIDTKKLKSDTSQYLLDISRDSVQIILNQLFSLPTTATEDGVVVELVTSTGGISTLTYESPSSSVVTHVSTVLPREKPLPKDRSLTKWERFAKEKGIQKRKKTRMILDEGTGEYRPRWGYGSAKTDPLKDWVIEVPHNKDPFEDQYAKRNEEKRERISKNKSQNLRNMSEAASKSTGRSPRDLRKSELEARISASKHATASMGRFDKKLNGDIPKVKGIKRKFNSGEHVAEEKTMERYMAKQVLNKADKIKGVVDKTKAANKFGVEVERANSHRRAKLELKKQASKQRKRKE